MTLDKSSPQKNTHHPRNKNSALYDLEQLCQIEPSLTKHLSINKYGNAAVNFSSPLAVKLLNKAILNHYYSIKYWEFPDQNLCPVVPGRADYVHLIADLISADTLPKIRKGSTVTGLDLGTGASGIYPILAVSEYNWNMIASDIDPKSIDSAENIISKNISLQGKVTCKLQSNPAHFFRNIIDPYSKINFTMCNPPFHASHEELMKGVKRKVLHVAGKKTKEPYLNFAGSSNELIYEGGELNFLIKMINESKEFAKNCHWFTSLVSKEKNLPTLYKTLKSVQATEIKTLPLITGNKTARVLAWRF